MTLVLTGDCGPFGVARTGWAIRGVLCVALMTLGVNAMAQESSTVVEGRGITLRQAEVVSTGVARLLPVQEGIPKLVICGNESNSVSQFLIQVPYPD